MSCLMSLSVARVALLLLAAAVTGSAQITYTAAEVAYPGAKTTTPAGINNVGEIVGSYADATNHNHAFLRDTAGNYTSFDFPGASLTSAYSVADNGYIAGWYQLADGIDHGFLFTPGVGPTTIGNHTGTLGTVNYPAATQTWAYGVNGNGAVVGSYTDASGNTHGFKLVGGQFTTIDVSDDGTLGSPYTVAYAINKDGTVAGLYADGADYRPGSQDRMTCGTFIAPAGAVVTEIAVQHLFCSGAMRPALNDFGDVIYEDFTGCRFGNGTWHNCKATYNYRSSNGGTTQISTFTNVPSSFGSAIEMSGVNTSRTIVGTLQSSFQSYAQTRGFVTYSCGSVNVTGPTPSSLPASGGAASMTVDPSGTCFWEEDATDWLSVNGVTGQQLFSGKQTLSIVAQANTSEMTRVGNVLAGGTSPAISQDGGATCVVSMNTITIPATAAVGTQLQFPVSAPAGCYWTANEQYPYGWFSVTSGAGSGNGHITISVGGQPYAYFLNIGALLLNGHTINVVQQPPTVVASTYTPIAPCRIVDSRLPATTAGVFGGPSLPPERVIDVPGSHCGIPSNASAYAVNLTVIPKNGNLGYASVSPITNIVSPTSTLNSLDGRVVANAVMVGAGPNGGIHVYASDPTDFVIDINGYFTPGASGLGYFPPLSPCRVADTRVGGSKFTPDAPSQDLAIPDSCAPASPAYVLNATAVPNGSLGYLTLWPTGSAMPFVSTLNSLDGDIVANMAIVPTGTGNSVSAYMALGGTSDLVLDLFGRFDTGGMKFYALPSCRAVDTRPYVSPDDPRSGSSIPNPLTSGTTRNFSLVNAPCGVPPGAQAVAVNVTAVPSGTLYYLKAWDGGAQTPPPTSLLNSLKGRVLANAAIVPTSDGTVNMQIVGAPTDVIIDVNGYFGQ